MRMLLKVTLATLVITVGGGSTHAGTAVPDSLVIGYDNEGKIDASPAACLASVKEVTEWDKAQTEKGAKQVCAARKRHVEAYAALQSNYKNFVKAFSVDQRLDLPSAVSNLQDSDQGLHTAQVRSHHRRPQHHDRRHRERHRRPVPCPGKQSHQGRDREVQRVAVTPGGGFIVRAAIG